ncbi:MAG: hypothetical protein JRI79_07845 [Deltaproteobacteria bacterium]|nr:hypothetical protein [Deltaproteobacteria bacterium]MBW1919562.1 hypothetical protein [Deltaproteobacteria bacterium]MBW1934979.1 hypothetical protein [Deltaproteobacteria bacterium]MBW1977867.1 hypothetical protein [Deltaproteobacteria bacterium]MBW2045026.1 hypothetical protein [Deltaproteobacteria bacterium]
MGTKKTQKASDYHEKAILEQLEDLADKLSIEVRYERFTGEGSLSTGGLCRVKDRHFFIINSKASTKEKVEALGAALSRFDLGSIYVRPGLREFLSRFRKNTASN